MLRPDRADVRSDCGAGPDRVADQGRALSVPAAAHRVVRRLWSVRNDRRRTLLLRCACRHRGHRPAGALQGLADRAWRIASVPDARSFSAATEISADASSQNWHGIVTIA